MYLVVEQTYGEKGYIPIKIFNVKYSALMFAEAKQIESNKTNSNKEYFVLPIEYQIDRI
jgi:hypothetical protein